MVTNDNRKFLQKIFLYAGSIVAGACSSAAGDLQQELAGFLVLGSSGFNNAGNEADPLLGVKVSNMQVSNFHGGIVRCHGQHDMPCLADDILPLRSRYDQNKGGRGTVEARKENKISVGRRFWLAS